MKRKKLVSYAKYGYLFSIPFVLAFLMFMCYPTIYTLSDDLYPDPGLYRS